MPIVTLTRKRKKGPGLVSRQVALGVSTRYNWWNGLPQAPVTINTTSTQGLIQVTLDNVHPEWSPKVRKTRPPKPEMVKVKRVLRPDPKEDLTNYRYSSPKKEIVEIVVPKKRDAKSVSHLSWKPVKSQTYRMDAGGDFSSFIANDESVIRGSGSYYTPPVGMTDGMMYVGGFMPAQWPQTPFSTTDLQNAGYSGKFTGEYGTGTDKGPEAWNKYKPKLYTADMGQFVGEIRETLPMLRTTASVFSNAWKGLHGQKYRKFIPRDLAGHWLNAQFGWAPFLGDLVKLCSSYEFLEEKRKRCIRQNGQFLRRGGPVASSGEGEEVFVAESTAQHTQYVMPSTQLNINPLVPTPPGNAKASYSRITYRETYRTWFEGSFRYWVPEFSSPDEAVNAILINLRMYGLRISPLLVWNLTPWSWLADWVGNIGDNISNYTTQAQDNLTAKYAYIMKETVGVMKNSSWIKFKDPYGTQTFEWQRYFTSKTRRHASAFGFTIDIPNFSAYQWSILAALGWPRLGYTRSPITASPYHDRFKALNFNKVGLVR